MRNLLQNMIAIFAIILLATSCQYKAIVEPPPPDPDDTIYFSQQIEPIWTDQGCTGCHPSVNNPDLTSGNSYNSISSLGMVIANDPDGSKIYYYPSPVGSHAESNKYSDNQAALIKQWIEQGALNN